MKTIYLKNTESSLYQPQYSQCHSNVKEGFQFYDEVKTGTTLSVNTIDIEARSLMSSRLSKRYSRSLLERGHSLQSKVNIKTPIQDSRKSSNASLNECSINRKVEIFDQLKNNSEIHQKNRPNGFQIEKQNYSDMFAKKVNYKGIILFEPNPYLLPVNRKDKKKHQTKVSDVSLLLFNQYMKRSNEQKEKMARVLHKQFARDVDNQNAELNYMKKSEIKNNNFFNKNLKRKLVKNMAKQSIPDISATDSSASSRTIVAKQQRSQSEDQSQFHFARTQNSFFAKEKGLDDENKQKNPQQQQDHAMRLNNQGYSYNNISSEDNDYYGTITQNQITNNTQKPKRSLSGHEKKDDLQNINMGSKRQTFLSIYKDRISNLSKILNDQKSNQITPRPQTANSTGTRNHSNQQHPILTNEHLATINHTINRQQYTGYY